MNGGAATTTTEHAAVYLAADRSLAREVAVKIHRNAEKHARERAIFESQTAAWLDHPNIVKILDVGEHSPDGGTAWLFSVFELCDCDLVRWCEEQREWEAVVDLHVQVGRALIHMHEAGYVHRDVKPTNVLVKDGVPMLADFGAVARPGAAVDLAGTAGFIPPEAVDQGSRPSFSGDLYGLAATLWACLYFQLPFAVPSGPHVTRELAVAVSLQRAHDREFAAPRVIPPGLPDAVWRLLVRALDPDPRQRPSLEQFVTGLVAILEKARRRRRLRRRAPVVAVGVVAILGIGYKLGAARHSGSGAVSILDAVRGVIEDPLDRAEIAARMGDGEVVVAEVNRTFTRAPRMSAAELEAVSARVDRIAQILEFDSPDHAEILRDFAKRFRRFMTNPEAHPKSK